MNTGGTGGTCTRVGYSATAGRWAKVNFPGPPPKVEVYEGLDADSWSIFRDARSAGTATVNVTCDAAGACTGADY